MRDLSELNLTENGKPVTRPGPNAKQIAVVENLVGARLPEAYITFLIFSNGGQPELNCLYTEFEGNEQRWQVAKFLQIAADSLAAANPAEVIWAYQQRGVAAPASLLPIALASDGSNYFCLDLAKTGMGKVVLWSSAEPEFSALPVADSFAEFIDSLTKDPLAGI